MNGHKTSRSRMPWFVRITNPLRAWGWIVCAAMLTLCLWPRQPSPLLLGAIFGWALAWPLLAMLHTARAKDARRAGFRNMLVDALGFALFSAALSFSVIPTTTLIFFLVFSSVALGGYRLALRGLLVYAVTVALTVAVLRPGVQPQVSALAAWFCIVCIVIYTLPGIALFYRGNRRLIELRQFLPRAVASVVMNQGRVNVLSPRKLEVTVCCFDLRGFTSYSESAEATALMAMLADYYRLVGETVEAHAGTVERFAGDGMVAFFNAPIALDAPELHALRACLDVQKGFKRLRDQWPSEAQALGLGVGMATGIASAGAVGYGEHWQYAAIGPVTNLSARLCSQAADGEVLVPAPCLASVDGVESQALGRKPVRGLVQPIDVHNVLGLADSHASEGT